MTNDYDTTVLLLDVETTGITPTDQVIELAVQYGFDDGAGGPPPVSVWRFKPTVPIHPAAQAVHGISEPMLDHEPPFLHHAQRIQLLIDEAMVLIGYNIGFDLTMLEAELARANLRMPDLSGKAIVDPFNLWKQCEPRTLTVAHRRFVGGDFDGAHGAVADIAATGRVTLGMLDAFGLAGEEWRVIADKADPDRKTWLGNTSHFKWAYVDGDPVVVKRVQRCSRASWWTA